MFVCVKYSSIWDFVTIRQRLKQNPEVKLQRDSWTTRAICVSKVRGLPTWDGLVRSWEFPVTTTNNYSRMRDLRVLDPSYPFLGFLISIRSLQRGSIFCCQTKVRPITSFRFLCSAKISRFRRKSCIITRHTTGFSMWWEHVLVDQARVSMFVNRNLLWNSFKPEHKFSKLSETKLHNSLPHG